MEKDNLKRNLVIAEFMGGSTEYYTNPANVQYVSFESHNIFPEDLNYHVSWDSLMEVIEKIEEIRDEEYVGFHVKIVGKLCIIYNDAALDDEMNYDVWIKYQYPREKKIKSVYEAVYEFILFYNENIKDVGDNTSTSENT